MMASVCDFLEGIGEKVHSGHKIPFIAVPTTAGTGSEATKNAVLSIQGKDGFKKSFRDEQLVAQYALVDPDLLATCPPELIAANGMDAFTQLFESYVALGASPFTDALAWSGMQAFRDGFWPAWEGDGSDAAEGRARLAYASLCSGITLAQAGLGSVHGLASPLGAYFPIPHGVVCGTLVAAATRVNIRALRARAPDSPALRKYAEAGLLLSGRIFASEAAAQDGLVELLDAEPAIAAPPDPVPLPEQSNGLISLDHVSFSYPSRPDTLALDDVSLDFSGGETLAIVGPSGAGKSTLFQLLLRFYDPVSGRILVDGIDISQAAPETVRERIGLVPQELAIYPDLTAKENLRFFGRLYGMGGTALASRMDEVLEVIGERRFISIDEIKHTTRLGMGACRGKRCIMRLKQTLRPLGISVVGTPTPRARLPPTCTRSRSMVTLIRRAIEVDPGERFPDAASMRDAFQRIRRPLAS